MAKAQYAAPWSICVYRRLGRVIDELGLLIGAWRVYCTWIPFYAGPQHTHTHALFVFFPIAPAHSVHYVCLFRFYSAVDFSTYVRFECYCCCVYIFFSVGFLLPCHGILKLENDTATKHFMLTTASNTIPVSLNRENQGGEKWWAALAMYVSVYSFTLSHFVFVVVNLSFVVVWIVKPLIALRNGIKLAPIFHAIHQYQNLYLSSFFCWQM